MSAKDIFTDIYARKAWGDGSGGGSVHSGPYIEHVNALIRKHRPKTILDIGCGDMVVASKLDLMGAKYIGWDAAANCGSKPFLRAGYHIEYSKDALTDELPQADMVLCKEVMQHLSNDDVWALVTRMVPHKVCVICNAYDDTHSPIKRNGDTHTGGFRPIEIGARDQVFFGPEGHRYIIETFTR